MNPGRWIIQLWVLWSMVSMPYVRAGENELGDIFKVNRATVRFSSEMPLELIEAGSVELSGVLNIRKGTFSFSIPVSSFKGFNNPLQQEHFNENYMETSRFPLATYKGKLIETIDIKKPGPYEIRTKGKLWIHGIDRQVLIPVHIIVGTGTIRFRTDFSLLLTDHGIKVPRIVDKNLSNEIHVKVEGVFIPL